MDVLPIDEAPVAPLVVGRNGAPIWPVRTAEQRAALERLCTLLGCKVRPTVSRPGHAFTDRGEVLGIGDEVESATRLYAHLTRRRARLVRRVNDFTAGCLPHAVVMLSSMLSPELLHQLYPLDANGPVPGIVCAETSAQLESQVLVRSAAAAIAGRSPLRTVEVYPTIAFGSVRGRTELCFGKQADPGDVRWALRAGAEITMVVSHGDGIDAMLHRELTLCPMRRRAQHADPAHAPYCVVTGHCIRHDIPVADAVAGNRLMDPESVQARILVWGVCHGTLPRPYVTDPAWGLFDRLLDNASIGAIVTSSGPIVISPVMLRPLLRSLARGASVGAALHRLNRSSMALREGLRLYLFGDPDVRVSAPVSRAELPQSTKAIMRSHDTSLAPFHDIEFLRAYLTVEQAHCKGEDQRRAAVAVAELAQYEMAVWKGEDVEAGAEAPGPRLRRAVIEFLYSGGTMMFQEWMRLVRSRRSIPSSPCFQCGADTSDLILRLRVSGGHTRRLRACPRCDVIEDAPLRSYLTLRLEGDRMLLGGDLPTRAWSAGLRLGCQNEPESHAHDWPADPRGTPARWFAPPQPWPPGALKIALILMVGASLAIVQVPGRDPVAPRERS